MTLKDQLDAFIAEDEAKAKTNPDMYRGPDWWQLSDAEEQVFDIRRDDWPRLFNVFWCYEAFKLIAHSAEWDQALIEQTRQQRPEWCDTPSTNEEFCAFAQAFGDLTNREADALYVKQQFWTVRLGVVVYADEQQSADLDDKLPF